MTWKYFWFIILINFANLQNGTRSWKWPSNSFRRYTRVIRFLASNPISRFDLRVQLLNAARLKFQGWRSISGSEILGYSWALSAAQILQLVFSAKCQGLLKNQSLISGLVPKWVYLFYTKFLLFYTNFLLFTPILFQNIVF